MSKKEKKIFFTQSLMGWHEADNKRSMPWKGEKDPYRIWISEIILQQTRVEQGKDYYLRFIATFPTIERLVKAPQSSVYKMWEGLGYYSRCKNLIAAGAIIHQRYNNKFPAQYAQLRELPGIGPYTAAAIASFAFDLPYAVVDGNVFRVLSRYFGDATPVDSVQGKKLFTALAAELLDEKMPALYNQAIMDLGAVVCKPRQPLCTLCPLKSKCTAFLKGTNGALPVKEKKLVRKQRWFYYLFIRYQDKVYLRKRTTKDIWQNLYEFVLQETIKGQNIKKLRDLSFIGNWAEKRHCHVISLSEEFAQPLSHQTISGRILEVMTDKPLILEGYKAVTINRLSRFPFPKPIADFLKDRVKA